MLQQDSLEQRREALLTEYSEVSSTFRMLTDIRFKLLAFLPTAAAAAEAPKPEYSGANELAFSLFGLVVTIGLVTYNARNDQLYDEWIARAAAIERSINIPDGAFANRPTAWLRLKLPGGEWKIDHRTAVSTIYSASIALWLFGVVSYGLGTFVKGSKPWVLWIAIAIAIIVTYWASRLIRAQKKNRQKEMRRLANLEISTIVCYHGGVVSEDANGQLRRVILEVSADRDE
jgi:preprotein translocase subunit YajC